MAKSQWPVEQMNVERKGRRKNIYLDDEARSTLEMFELAGGNASELFKKALLGWKQEVDVCAHGGEPSEAVTTASILEVPVNEAQLSVLLTMLGSGFWGKTPEEVVARILDHFMDGPGRLK